MDEENLDLTKPETSAAQVQMMQESEQPIIQQENLENYAISLKQLESLVEKECDDILQDREEMNLTEIKALAEELTAENAYDNTLQMDMLMDIPTPKQKFSAVEEAIYAPSQDKKLNKEIKKEDILPQKPAAVPKEEKPQENKARAKFILFGKKTKEAKIEEPINFFAAESTSQILEDLPLPPKPPAKSKTSSQKTQEKIRAFFQKNQSVPTAYVYYAIFPSAQEREQFLIEKNVNFVKLFVWDGEAHVAFSVQDHEIYEVQSAAETTIVRDDWAWRLNKYSKAERFIQSYDGLCKNFGKMPDHKATQAKFKEWHDNLTKRTVVNYANLQEYQTFLDEHQSNNRARYQDSKNDFKECQKARKSIGSFLKKL